MNIPTYVSVKMIIPPWYNAIVIVTLLKSYKILTDLKIVWVKKEHIQIRPDFIFNSISFYINITAW